MKKILFYFILFSFTLFLLILYLFFIDKIAFSANSYKGNPMTMDATADYAKGYLVSRLEWHPAAANNDLLLKDASSNVIWAVRATAGASNHESYGIEIKDFNPPKYLRGLYLNTIDGGTLYIWRVD